MALVSDLVQIGFESLKAKHLGTGSISPESFGAVADGVFDCTDALNKSFSYLSSTGGAVRLSNGTYKISSALTGYSNVSFLGNGPGSIIKSNFSLASGKSLFNLIGSSSGSTTLTADVAIGDRTITVASTTSFTADSFIYIVQSSNYAQLHRIKTVTDSTHLLLHEPISFFWLSGDSVYRGDWKNNVTVSGIQFIGTELSSEDTRDRYEDHAVNSQMAHHIYVTGCSFLNIGSRAIIFIDRCGDCIATDNRAIKCYDRAIEAHHETSGCVISNNAIMGGLIGVSVHGIGTVATGNTCKGQYGTDSGGTLRGSGLVAGDLYYGVISNNTCLGAQREGMAIGSDVYNTLISSNTIAFSKRDGITFNGARCAIINNNFAENGTQVNDACISLVAATSDLYINGNYFHARTDSSVTTRAVYSTFDQTNLNLGTNDYKNFPGAVTVLSGTNVFAGAFIGESDALRRVFLGFATWDPASIAVGAYTTKDVTVTGVRYGDKISVSFSIQITDGVDLTGRVLSNDTVRVTLYNFASGGAYDLGSGTISVMATRDRFGVGGTAG